MSLTKRSSGEEVNFVRPPTSMLRSAVSQSEAVVDQNLLTSMLRSKEDTVTPKSLRPEFNLDIFQMEVEGRRINPQVGFVGKDTTPRQNQQVDGLSTGLTASTKPKAIASTVRMASWGENSCCRMG